MHDGHAHTVESHTVAEVERLYRDHVRVEALVSGYVIGYSAPNGEVDCVIIHFAGQTYVLPGIAVIGPSGEIDRALGNEGSTPATEGGQACVR